MYLKMDVNTFQRYLDTYTDYFELNENVSESSTNKSTQFLSGVLCEAHLV